MEKVKLLTEEEKKEVFARQIRASGWLYMVAYKKLVGKYGFEGRTTIREWMRTWGIWRGEQTRKGHHALGLEISMENLMLNWDSDAAATPDLKEAWKKDPKCRFTPGCVKIITPPGHYSCPQQELWAEHDFLYEAHVHCDEFHVKYTQGYHPEATVVVPECMTKKDPACHFTFLRDPEAKDPPHLPLYEGEDPLKDWKADTDEERQETTLRRKARITAGRVIFLWKAIKNNHPEDAEQDFAEIMDEWCRERGGDMHKYLVENHLETEISAKMFEYFDHPYYITWGTEISEDDKKVQVDVSYCPFAETWKWVDKEALPIIKRYYCDQCYKNVLGGAFPNSKAELTSCLLAGDEKCCIEISKSK